MASKAAFVTLALLSLSAFVHASSTVDDKKTNTSVIVTSSSSTDSNATANVTVPQVFAFGDQYLDTGMTNRLNDSAGWNADVEPYGKGINEAAGRFCDGKLTIDYITEDIGSSDYLMPYLTDSLRSSQGTSFATAGAGTKPWINSNKTWSLQHQLEFFNQYAADRHGMRFNTAVFVISIGTNDYLESILGDGGDKAAAALVSSTTNAIMDALLALFKATRSTKFVVYDLPPLGCIPAVRLAKGLLTESDGCYEPANKIAADHNQALSMKLDKLRAAGVKDLVLFRMSGGFENVLLKDGSAFTSKLTPCCEGKTPKGERISCGQTVEEGGKNYTASVCEEPAKSVWWDDYNPTAAANNQLEFVLWNSNSVLFVRPNGLKKALA